MSSLPPEVIVQRIRVLVVALVLALAPALVLTPPAASAQSVQTVMSGLDQPWDVGFFRNGDMLLTERSGRIRMRTAAGDTWVVQAPELSSVYANSEGGLMGLVVDPTTVRSYFYTCQTYQSGGRGVDVRVTRWWLTPDGRRATVEKTLITGIPLTSGRHSGCRVRFAPGYQLLVATGDAAIGTSPQDLQSLGGKVLRIGPTAEIPRDNPFISRGGNARLVYTYGHRNLQGLAIRPGSGQIWSQEHGPNRDDETNLIQRGGNYGWHPVPGYNESVPMTDTKQFPNAIPARWTSGDTTTATAGITFLEGNAWGRWNGALAIAELKGAGVRILSLDASGRVTRDEQLPALAGTYGRIRTVQSGPGGALYVTTGNGNGSDRVLRVGPSAPR